MNSHHLTKKELLVQVGRFLRDPARGISVMLFAELCGISKDLLQKVFLDKVVPMTETTQRRVNAGYAAWKEGRVKIMRRKDGTRFVDYRKVAEPVVLPHMGLKVTNEGIKLRIGAQNRHDYSEPTLDEALRG